MACGKFHKASKGNWFSKTWNNIKGIFNKGKNYLESDKFKEDLNTARKVVDTGSKVYNQAKDFAQQRGWNTDNRFTRFVDGTFNAADKGLNTVQGAYDHIAPFIPKQQS